MKSIHRYFALIPAAGMSVRMGRPKLALPLGGRTVLEHTIDAFRADWIDTILVVLGPHTADLAHSAGQAGAEILLLEAQTPDMRSTLEQGLHWIGLYRQPTELDYWFFTPADYPLLHQDVIRTLRDVASSRVDKSIFIPVHEGRRGHPALISWRHANAIRSLQSNTGVNAYLQQQSLQSLEVPVHSPDILYDLDNPDDYEQLLKHWQR